MKLTKKQAVKEHRKMWNWIADETERQKRKVSKEDYFNAHPEYEIPFCKCFCCEYDLKNGIGNCVKCPIKWSGARNIGICCCIENAASYNKWFYSMAWKDAAKYAREIANLPERTHSRKNQAI